MSYILKIIGFSSMKKDTVWVTPIGFFFQVIWGSLTDYSVNRYNDEPVIQALDNEKFQV